jgi:hypothetical protein
VAWRNPQYAYNHAAREIGVANITTDTEDTSYPHENMIDDRFGVGPSFKFTGDVAGHYIQLDMAWSLQVTGHNRLYIPAGHNLNGAKIQIDEDTTTAFSGSEVNLYAKTLISSDAALDIPFDTAQGRQYLRVSFPDNAGIWEIPQLFVSKLITTTCGPEPRFVDELRPNVLQFDNGDSVQIDSDQRYVSYDYRIVGLAAAADLTNFEAMIAAVSTHRPFLLDRTESTDAAVVMKLVNASTTADTDVPASLSRTRRVQFEMLEYLG